MRRSGPPALVRELRWPNLLNMRGRAPPRCPWHLGVGDTAVPPGCKAPVIGSLLLRHRRLRPWEEVTVHYGEGYEWVRRRKGYVAGEGVGVDRGGIAAEELPAAHLGTGDECRDRPCRGGDDRSKWERGRERGRVES